MKSPLLLRSVPVLLLAAALCVCGGCSFSKSSKASSKSSSSPSQSSSESSRSDASRYREEVVEYAQGFVRAGGGDAASFQTGLTRIAEKRGVSDWESNPDTWKSLGAGLKKAKVSQAAFDGYSASWTGGDAARVEQMRQGYKK